MKYFHCPKCSAVVNKSDLCKGVKRCGGCVHCCNCRLSDLTEFEQQLIRDYQSDKKDYKREYNAPESPVVEYLRNQCEQKANRLESLGILRFA